ncbi:alpha/beta hydrolase [Myxococcaceae bacterium GXIMD 01537]
MPYRRTTRFVTAADGTRIAYHTHMGNLPEPRAEAELARQSSVLLTNGVGTSENFWQHIVSNLEQDHRVVHWNYRGHGSSEVSRGGYGVSVHVSDLERVTEEATAQGGGRPVHHIAFSMGVRILLELYRKRPELVPSMTLIAGSAGAPGSSSRSLVDRMVHGSARRMLRSATPLVPAVTPAVHALLGSRFAYPLGRAVGALRPRAPRADIAEFMLALRRMSPEAYWYTLLGLTEGDAWDVLPTLDVPTLLIAARHDVLVPLREMKRMREALPWAQWLLVEDAGHAGLIEAGPEIANTVRDFLVRNGLESAASPSR